MKYVYVVTYQYFIGRINEWSGPEAWGTAISKAFKNHDDAYDYARSLDSQHVTVEEVEFEEGIEFNG